jgi:hypothetical protein
LGALATAALVALGFLNRQNAVYDSTLSELESKRNAITKAKYRIVAPKLVETYEAYSTLKSFRERVEKSGDILEGVFEEDPSEEFEKCSKELRTALVEWVSWTTRLARERRKLRWAGYFNGIGICSAIGVAAVAMANLDPMVGQVSGILMLTTFILQLVLIHLHIRSRHQIKDEWDHLTVKRGLFQIDTKSQNQASG